MTTWTPTPLLLTAPPFPYDDEAISHISNTEAFDTAIDARDSGRCIVCGREIGLEHCHLVPKFENERWEFLRQKGLIPSPSKGVRHEARNGVLMCRNHHDDFNQHRFFIRWEPTSRRFVFINLARFPDLDCFHGRAVRLFPGDQRIPFYGAFLDQEMRVRGRYPYLPEFADRPIEFPPKWQSWIENVKSSGGSSDGGHNWASGGEDDNEDGEEDEGERSGDDLSPTALLKPCTRSSGRETYDNTAENDFQANAATSLSRLVQRHPVPNKPATHSRHRCKRKLPNTTTFKNPMTNTSELEGIMRYAHQQPSWKAAVIEGESWEGTAEENIAKYMRVLPPAQLSDTSGDDDPTRSNPK